MCYPLGTGTNGFRDIFIHDRLTSVATSGTAGDNNCQRPSVSSGGRFSAFSSDAGNLPGAGKDTQGFRDVFVTMN